MHFQLAIRHPGWVFVHSAILDCAPTMHPKSLTVSKAKLNRSSLQLSGEEIMHTRKINVMANS
jgi:hypothetical protein